MTTEEKQSIIAIIMREQAYILEIEAKLRKKKEENKNYNSNKSK